MGIRFKVMGAIKGTEKYPRGILPTAHRSIVEKDGKMHKRVYFEGETM